MFSGIAEDTRIPAAELDLMMYRNLLLYYWMVERYVTSMSMRRPVLFKSVAHQVRLLNCEHESSFRPSNSNAPTASALFSMILRMILRSVKPRSAQMQLFMSAARPVSQGRVPRRSATACSFGWEDGNSMAALQLGAAEQCGEISTHTSPHGARESGRARPSRRAKGRSCC
eukprot:COSAG05_NODE_377_length_10608_cov_17.523361_6_plen_171_part_00